MEKENIKSAIIIAFINTGGLDKPNWEETLKKLFSLALDLS